MKAKKMKSKSTVLVPVSATIFVPLSRADIQAEKDHGKSMAEDIVRNLELTIGGVIMMATPK